MAITVSNIQDDVNTYIGDSGTNTVSAAQRLSAISEATSRLSMELENDHMNSSVELDQLDTVFYYKINTTVPDLIEPVDLRLRTIDQQKGNFSRISSRELFVNISEGKQESLYSIERRDGNRFLVINYNGRFTAKQISSFDSLTDGGGTWVLDETTSDATNLTVDTNEFLEGSASLNFDADVSQSGNNKAVILN